MTAPNVTHGMPLTPRQRPGGPFKRDSAAGLVRGMIADGTIRPGGAVPSGAALARKTGYSVHTCRAALRSLLADGTLRRGASQGARLRVATVPGAGGADEDASRRRLSAGLAARRRAAGLTQPMLAALLGVSVTTIGHAETGRVWQARGFWQRAGAVLGDDGELLRLYDEHLAGPASLAAPKAIVLSAPLLPVSIIVAADGVVITWPDGTKTTARPPRGAPAR